jgi:glycosyltransferase involved in cell wall biosynthesis
MMRNIKESKENPRRDDAPVVSVIIPAYQAARHIGETLDSVLHQTFKAYEIIVVNDGSPDTDDLERVLAPFGDRVIYLKRENGGPAAARNTGIRAARGEYLAFLDSDDLYLPEHLQEQLGFMKSGGYDFTYCDALLFGHSPLAGHTFMELVPSEGEVTFETLLAAQCTVITSTVVARKQPILDAGLFDEKHTYIVPAEDYDLWLRLAKRGTRMAFQQKPLIKHRKHAESLSANSVRAFEGALHVLNRVEQEDSLTAREQSVMAATILRLQAALELERSKQQLVNEDFQAAAEAVRKANNFYRKWKLHLVYLWLKVAPRLLLSLYLLRHRKPANPNLGGVETS